MIEAQKALEMPISGIKKGFLDAGGTEGDWQEVFTLWEIFHQKKLKKMERHEVEKMNTLSTILLIILCAVNVLGSIFLVHRLFLDAYFGHILYYSFSFCIAEGLAWFLLHYFFSEGLSSIRIVSFLLLTFVLTIFSPLIGTLFGFLFLLAGFRMQLIYAVFTTTILISGTYMFFLFGKWIFS